MASTTTPYIFSGIFLLLSITGLYHMHILPTQLNIPINLSSISQHGHLNIPFQHIRIPQHYTGLKPLDNTLAILVSAFSHGALRLDEDAFWQQIHFLLGIFPLLAIWTIEAFRERNQGKLISYTSIWALFYQVLGGAFVVPLMNLCYVLAGAGQAGYLRSGRVVPGNVAEVLVPALLLGYLVPTILVYLPFFAEQMTLYFVVFWQFSPIYVNVLVAVLSRQAGGSRSTKKKGAPDVQHLKLVYILSIAVAFVAHVFTISNVLLGNTGEASLLSIFVPSRSRLFKSTGQDFHFIFQWDWLVVAISAITWAVYAIIEVQTELKALSIEGNVKGLMVLLAIHLLLEGPGGAVAAVWWWRENALLEIERQAHEKTK